MSVQVQFIIPDIYKYIYIYILYTYYIYIYIYIYIYVYYISIRVCFIELKGNMIYYIAYNISPR